MATKKNVDTSALFRNLIGDEGEKDTEPKVPEKSVPEKKEMDMENLVEPVKIGRQANEEKNTQVSIYLTPGQDKELRLQAALKEKESDKSAIARTGIDIVLSLSAEMYGKLKSDATQNGKTPGQVVQEIVTVYYEGK